MQDGAVDTFTLQFVLMETLHTIPISSFNGLSLNVSLPPQKQHYCDQPELLD